MSLLSLRDLSRALFTYLGRTAFFKAFGQNWSQCDVSGLVLPALWCIVSDMSRPPEGIRFCLVSTRTNLLLLSRMLIYCPELGNTCAKPHYKFSSGKIALSSLQSEIFWWGFCNSVTAELHILLKQNWLLTALRLRSPWGLKKLFTIAFSFLEFWSEKKSPYVELLNSFSALSDRFFRTAVGWKPHCRELVQCCCSPYTDIYLIYRCIGWHKYKYTDIQIFWYIW